MLLPVRTVALDGAACGEANEVHGGGGIEEDGQAEAEDKWDGQLGGRERTDGIGSLDAVGDGQAEFE
jgi:hypothetical protein